MKQVPENKTLTDYFNTSQFLTVTRFTGMFNLMTSLHAQSQTLQYISQSCLIIVIYSCILLDGLRVDHCLDQQAN